MRIMDNADEFPKGLAFASRKDFYSGDVHLALPDHGGNLEIDFDSKTVGARTQKARFQSFF